jgi:hypothetical protein
MHVRTHAAGHVEYGGGFEGWPVWHVESPVDRLPLIEAPVETRLRALKKLPEFVRAVARLFTIDPREVEQPRSDFDEIPS